jgi:hypothetical protein
VTSTVNIKTPEFTESDAPFSPEEGEGIPEPPFSPRSESAWRGGISMQDVATFNVSAEEVTFTFFYKPTVGIYGMERLLEKFAVKSCSKANVNFNRKIFVL